MNLKKCVLALSISLGLIGLLGIFPFYPSKPRNLEHTNDSVIRHKSESLLPPPIPRTAQNDSFKDEIQEIKVNYKKHCSKVNELVDQLAHLDEALGNLQAEFQNGIHKQESFDLFNRKSAERTKLGLIVAFCQGDEFESELVRNN